MQRKFVSRLTNLNLLYSQVFIFDTGKYVSNIYLHGSSKEVPLVFNFKLVFISSIIIAVKFQFVRNNTLHFLTHKQQKFSNDLN